MTHNKIYLFFLFIFLLSSCSVEESDENRFTQITEDWADPVYRQYDFWLGERHINWVQPVPGEILYPELGGQASQWMYPALNGKAMLEFTLGDDPVPEGSSRTYGFSVRYFDTNKNRWVMAQEWPNNFNSTNGVLDQLMGFYRFGRVKVFSTFTPRGSSDDVEVTRRYTFTAIRPEGFIWHWMGTADNGNTWVERSLAENSMVTPVAVWPKPGEPLPGYHGGDNCTDPKFLTFNDLAGEWEGTVVKDGLKENATLTGYLMLGGCAVLNYIEFENKAQPYTLLEVRSIFRDKPEWWVYQLDSRHGTAHTYQAGTIGEESFTFYDNPHWAIQGEFINHSLSKLKREDDKALKKTVWTTLSPTELTFEWWVRETAEDEWELDASFKFNK